MITSVRTRLGGPRAQRPDDMQALNALSTELRTIKRHESNTSNVWNFNDVIINVAPNNATYLINAEDFGVPLSVITYAPQLTTWMPRLIPIYQPQNLVYAYVGMPNIDGWANFLGYDGSQCTAERCAFYWKDGQPYIEFLPVPQLPAQYQCRYLESGASIGTDSLTSSPINAMDADLAEVRTAIALLPLTEWMAGDDANGRVVNTERRRDLAMSLSNTEHELRRQFEAAKLQVEGDRLTMRYNPTVG